MSDDMISLWGKETLSVAVLGAGSFGTSIAQLVARRGHPTHLWCRRETQAAAIQQDRRNPRVLSDVTLDDNITATTDLAEAVAGKDLVFSVVASQVTREVMARAAQHLSPGTIVVCASKGIEEGTHLRMDQVFEQVLPERFHPGMSFLSGPSFAKELIAGVPTAVSIASRNVASARKVQVALASTALRAYFTHDVVGVELGGALKNIIAIACGVADGLGLGANTQAALITRGLAEITRLALVEGADQATMAGLAGMGDLVLTCTGGLSRNRRVGQAVGSAGRTAYLEGRKRGLTDERARMHEGLDVDGYMELANLPEVAEGVRTCRATFELARMRGVEMPIVEQIHGILYQRWSPSQAVYELMTRPVRHENKGLG